MKKKNDKNRQRSSVKKNSSPSSVKPPVESNGTLTAPHTILPHEDANTLSSTPLRFLRLDGNDSTFLLIVRKTGLPEIAYWGKRIPAQPANESVFSIRAPNLPNNGPDQWRPLITVLDSIGGWNLDLPGLIASRPDGTAWTAEFDVTSITTSNSQIAIKAEDRISQLSLKLTFTMTDADVLSSTISLTNKGNTPLNVSRLISGNFLLPDTVSDFGVLHGAWTMEWGIKPVQLQNGALVIESRRNRIHDHFPGMLAGSQNTTQNEGEAYGFQLGWSGGNRLSVERMEDSRYRFSIGEYLYPGEGTLKAGETLTAPPAYGCYSAHGYAGIARAFQAYARRHVIHWPNNQMKPRPVLLNSWEGNEFNLNEEQLKKQIDIASTLGVERFVLDDGWFSTRRDDHQGLGDWEVATSVFPNGLRPLSDYVHNKNMEFGLWYEPEMVNPNSNLYRNHPDWVLQITGRPLLTSRTQLVLDISRQEVSDYLFNVISQEITDIQIDYIKWDFNRDLLDAADAKGRAAYRRQVQAIYALWNRLHKAHPDLEIESCASGGGRLDWGALSHAQRVWTSDNTSAINRLDMQGNAWHFLPPEVTGTHISAVPNGTDGRTTSLSYRAAIALFGHLGLELNPTLLSTEEKEELRQWIALHKRLRNILHHGVAQFGNEDPTCTVRGVTSTDQTKGIYLVAQKQWPAVRRPAPTYFPGLNPDKIYRVTVPAPQTITGVNPSPDQQKLYQDDGLTISGANLVHMGIFLPEILPQQAVIIEFSAV